MLQTLIGAVIGAVLGTSLGAVASWWFSWHYYKKAGDELRATAKELQQTLSINLYLLEHPEAKDRIEVKRDANGVVTGLNLKIAPGTADLSFGASGTLTNAPRQRAPRRKFRVERMRK